MPRTSLALLCLAACFTDTGPQQTGTGDSTDGTSDATGSGTTDDPTTTVPSTTDAGPTCGDAEQGPDEECDDGEDLNLPSASCTPDCKFNVCGDGYLATTEGCDDANTVSGDGCNAACALESCGDGVAQRGEECDDGNPDNTDACTSLCRFPECGDGFVQDGEACDDGNGKSTDACLETCELAACGDGWVHEDEEGCDDENAADGDGCSAACDLEFLRVFVTAETFTGALVVGDDPDDACQTEAEENGLYGTFRAWIPDTLDTPFDDFDIAPVPFVRADGMVVADSFDAFKLGVLQNPIALTAGGISPSADTAYCGDALVWTGTYSDGTPADEDCFYFTSDDPEDYGLVGNFNSVDSNWVDACAIPCDVPIRLYCFQQAE